MTFLSYTREFENNLLLLLLRDHRRYRPIVAFFDTATRRCAQLSWAEAELIAGSVSRSNRSAFCTGLRNGMSAALRTEASVLTDERLAPLLAFALKLNDAAEPVAQDDVQRVLEAGWSEQTVEDVVGLVAIQKCYNTLASGLGFDALPAEVSDQIGRDTLEKGGYLSAFQAFVQASVPPG